MRHFINLFQAFPIDKSIDLRCSYLGMAEKFLHNSQIRPAAQQVCGETMPEGMGSDILC